jgi:hypothetical protein
MLYSLRYTTEMPEMTAGQAWMWFIKIRPEYRNDQGLLEHEKEHVRQFWTRGLLIHGLRYKFSRAYRKQCEAEAYRTQLKYSPQDIEHFVRALVNKYDLGITVLEARTILT